MEEPVTKKKLKIRKWVPITLIVIIFSILAFVKTLGYALYEYQDKSNKVSGIIIGVMAVFALIAPTLVVIWK